MRWLVILLALSLAACGGEPDDPERQIREWVERGERAVEQRSLNDASSLIAPDYRDRRGHDRRAVVRTLLGYFHGHKSIYLLTRVRDIWISPLGDEAKLTVLVAMAGVPLESVDSLLAVKADYHRFDMRLVKPDDEWLLLEADWRRSSLDDLAAF